MIVCEKLLAGAQPPEDPPWLSHVLVSAPTAAGHAAQFRADTIQGCLHVATLDGQSLVQEKPPARLRERPRQRRLTLDIPKVEVRFDADRVDARVRLTFTVGPDEIFSRQRRMRCMSTAQSRRLGAMTQQRHR